MLYVIATGSQCLPTHLEAGCGSWCSAAAAAAATSLRRPDRLAIGFALDSHAVCEACIASCRLFVRDGQAVAPKVGLAAGCLSRSESSSMAAIDSQSAL